MPSALTVEAKYTLTLRGWAAVRMREKLSKAKPRDIKGVVCRGLPWSLFSLRFSSKLRDPDFGTVITSALKIGVSRGLVNGLHVFSLCRIRATCFSCQRSPARG